MSSEPPPTSPSPLAAPFSLLPPGATLSLQLPPSSRVSPMSGGLDLSSIRHALIRQEDTIIFALIERAQFAHNSACYDSEHPAYALLPTGGLAASGDSFLDFMLVETERLHARVRRYTSPDEHAFFPHRLPPPELPPLEFQNELHPVVVNLNDRIKQLYVHKVLPALCRAGDDQQHGSSVVADVAVLQAISKRVHYGMFVAEAKFRSQTEEYTRLIRAGDEASIMELLTNAAVEERVLKRVRKKASTFGREIVDDSGISDDAPLRVDPELIVTLYHDYVIPLTKEAEVEYLMQRLREGVIAFHGTANGIEQGLVSARFASSDQGGESSLLRLAEPADVVAAVMSGKVQLGVIVVEHGDSGVQAAPISLLRTCPTHVQVVDEIIGKSNFQLVSSTSLQSVTKVRGRREAVRLCATWLRRKLARVVDIEEVDLAHGQPPWATTLGRTEHATTAYIATQDTPLAPGINVLLPVSDEICERTRCLVLSSRAGDTPPAGCEKTLLLFGLSDGAGSLAKVLNVFTHHGVNLTYIQSHADLESPSHYNFFCELQGHARDTSMAAALEQLKETCFFVRILGSFCPSKH
mmetsp:Transcript_30138/g.75312  ORF Transcript_30138/g.75312 Transcript_30138/m.75312 type:complete len:580 (+) Transcript_30138:3-1742(+)